ncbi:unnamed protein product [Linum trigynum]|uniref:Uncharacterized protein n=1 Tax=Linum trigynum TaxID=586398 RepID=A0AAV2E353_9ROSI
MSSSVTSPSPPPSSPWYESALIVSSSASDSPAPPSSASGWPFPSSSSQTVSPVRHRLQRSHLLVIVNFSIGCAIIYIGMAFAVVTCIIVVWV